MMKKANSDLIVRRFVDCHDFTSFGQNAPQNFHVLCEIRVGKHPDTCVRDESVDLRDNGAEIDYMPLDGDTTNDLEQSWVDQLP